MFCICIKININQLHESLIRLAVRRYTGSSEWRPTGTYAIEGTIRSLGDNFAKQTVVLSEAGIQWIPLKSMNRRMLGMTSLLKWNVLPSSKRVPHTDRAKRGLAVGGGKQPRCFAPRSDGRFPSFFNENLGEKYKAR